MSAKKITFSSPLITSSQCIRPLYFFAIIRLSFFLIAPFRLLCTKRFDSRHRACSYMPFVSAEVVWLRSTAGHRLRTAFIRLGRGKPGRSPGLQYEGGLLTVVICCMSLKIGLFMFLRISISIFSLPQFYMPFFSPGSKLPLKLTLLHVLSDRPLIMLMVLQSIFIIIFVFS